MPIDYKNYHPEWKTKIRPDILERDNNCCKFCGVKNHTSIFRGFYQDDEVYQTEDANIYLYPSGKFLIKDAFAPIEPISGNENQKAIKIVLTIMHLDHDKENNEYDNLAAACQKCHLVYDKSHHMKNARDTNERKKKLQRLFK